MTTKSEKKLIDENVVYFYSGKKEYNSLSNFWPHKVVWKDHDGKGRIEYASGEHCFHGQKFTILADLCKDVERKEK
jgi:hypothetical protein